MNHKRVYRLYSAANLAVRSLSWPSDYEVSDSMSFCVAQDMLGNFAVAVDGAGRSGKAPTTYLVGVCGQRLKIVNKSF